VAVFIKLHGILRVTDGLNTITIKKGNAQQLVHCYTYRIFCTFESI